MAMLGDRQWRPLNPVELESKSGAEGERRLPRLRYLPCVSYFYPRLGKDLKQAFELSKLSLQTHAVTDKPRRRTKW